jgi:hypothetical protein
MEHPTCGCPDNHSILRPGQPMCGFDIDLVKLFYTGPVINTEMLVVMLRKHGIQAREELAHPEETDVDDLNREAKVFVPEKDYDRAYQLFYADREDEL